MNYESQKVASKKLIFEVEFTGDLQHFDECNEMVEGYLKSFIQLMCHAMWQRDKSFRAMYCVKDKPIVQKRKTHCEVQLPELNGAGKKTQRQVQLPELNGVRK